MPRMWMIMKAPERQKLLDGILLLNKPEGLSSNKALQKVKHLFGVKKAGHTGSLDPLATGMLPLCFGEATKICQYLLDVDKCYEATGLLGIKTNTSDSTGEVLAFVDDYCISRDQLEAVLSRYKGLMKQIPSMFSALKYQGKPLYRLARAGIEIERRARDIIIHQLTLDAFDGKHFSITVTCSKGTYIRNLLEDIGDDLQVGAHLTRLHRLYTAGFQNSPMYTLNQLENMSCAERLQILIPMDRAVAHFCPVVLSKEEILALRQGRVLSGKKNQEELDFIRLYDEQAQFIGLGQRQINGDIKAKRLLAFKVD